MILLILVILLFILLGILLYIGLNKKEGLKEDDFSLAIRSIETAMKDPRFNDAQKQALQDALYYARDIKRM